MTTAGEGLAGIDGLMEQASRALVEADYPQAEAWCIKAMTRARRAADYERMARICLPLQECRRQRRQDACDAGRLTVLRGLPARGTRDDGLPGGLYLVEPPMVGVEARTVRALLSRRRVPAMVLAREPTTAGGTWPIVAVGEIGAGVGVPLGLGQREPVVVRVRVVPRADGPDAAWFLAAQEALGDAAIARVRPEHPPDHRVDDLLEYLDAVPDHEKLMQALASACREAARTGPSAAARRRPVLNDPFGF